MSSVGRACDYFNQPWLEYRGRTMAEERGHGWLQGVHPEDVQRCMDLFESSYAQSEAYQAEYRLLRHDRGYRWVLDSGAPWIAPTGACLGYVGICLDIQRRKLEDEHLRAMNDVLLRQNEELTEFAQSASHDLQEPLRTIASCTQLLDRGYAGTGEHQRDNLIHFVTDAVARLQTLVSGILGYSAAFHRSEPTLVPIDCNRAFEKALLVCQAAISESHAVITHGSLPAVQADEVQLVQVFQNLLSNAIKYRRPGDVPRVHVSSTELADAWMIEVSDNGIGFEPQYADRIFGLFKRLHGSGEYRGTGLGLAICRKIVERHGGRIWATSEPGRGAQFFFTLKCP